jgi:ATP-dependent DNA helicase RecG
MKDGEFINLVKSFMFLTKETEWIEFKINQSDPQEIGEYISALSNSAALHQEINGYIVWGIENKTRKIVGTTFKPRIKKIGNEELENWLATQLSPRIDFQIHEGEIEGKPIVIFQIQPAPNLPVRFKDTEYIRIGTYKKKLRDHPEKERLLWKLFTTLPFENALAATDVSSDEVLELIDYPTYFRMMNIPLPENRKAILDRLSTEKIIFSKAGDRFDVANVGAVLFGYNLNRFERLQRKASRVIIYKGENRIETIKEQVGVRGYASGFEGLISYINDQLPQNEQIEQAFRKQVRIYPEIAIRELVVNALIHQDFNLAGTGPLIEIFSDRMEITNPGIPLIDTLRFIDEPPQSRNEKLASIMRRLNICEERGSGIDKVIFNVEVFQLPAPDFRVTSNHTVAVLFGPREFSEMDKADRVRACYQHACLCYVSGKQMTNTTLRERLNIKSANYPMASRIIRDTIEAGLIKPHSQVSESKKDAKYTPFWA